MIGLGGTSQREVHKILAQLRKELLMRQAFDR
jgi:hypothetical protein